MRTGISWIRNNSCTWLIPILTVWTWIFLVIHWNVFTCRTFGSSYTDTFIPDLGARWRIVAIFTQRPSYLKRNNCYCLPSTVLITCKYIGDMLIEVTSFLSVQMDTWMLPHLNPSLHFFYVSYTSSTNKLSVFLSSDSWDLKFLSSLSWPFSFHFLISCSATTAFRQPTASIVFSSLSVLPSRHMNNTWELAFCHTRTPM